MSRPESPLKSNLSDEDLIKKLKALLIKEKRISKENLKIINDLKVDNDKKDIENNLLIAQIQRLSENIGDLDDSETSKINELNDLTIKFNELQQINERLKTDDKERQVKEDIFKSDINEFMIKLKSSLGILVTENKEIFKDKVDLTEGGDILKIIEDITDRLRSRKEAHDVLQDGLTKITLKCNHLEDMIATKDEKIDSLSSYQKQLFNSSSELNQREEQIKRLEELIEDNRNISRALETERDQLQNDLVDLRQRHEEKEGYLIEEYKEAQLSLENYRIFTDKQSAEKANEMERLRKCLNDYQQGVTQEQFLTDCRLCRDVDSLFDKLKTDMNIIGETMSYEDIIVVAVEKYVAVTEVLNDHIDRLNENDHQCRQELEIMTEKVDNIERSLIENKVLEKVQIEERNYEELFEDLNQKLLEKEENLYASQKELEHVMIISRNIEDILEIDDSSAIIDSINKLISLNKDLTNEIHLCKCNMDEQRNRYEKMLEEKESYTNELITKLSEAGQHVNHNDLMNLEMAEIDKTLVNLNNQLSIKSNKLAEFESTIRSKDVRIEELVTEIQCAQKQNQQLDDRNNKMKQMLVKTKREFADCKNQYSVLQEKENLHGNEIEVLKIELDDTKVSLSESISEKEKLQERYNLFSKKMDSITKSREITIASLRSQIEATLQNYKDLQHEFDLYKVKVQTAFSTKARPSSVFGDFMTLATGDTSNDDGMSVKDFKKQVTDLEMNIDDLKIDLREKEEKIFSLQSDLDLMRWDNEKYSEKLKGILKENTELTMKIRQVTEQLQNDTKLQQISHSDMFQRFNSDKEKLDILHQKQIESIRSIYELEIENLTQKIEEKEMEKLKFQEEIWECREQLKTADHKLGQIKNSGLEHNRSSVTDILSQQLRSPLTQERQQGEGMEMINESENISSLSHSKILSPKQFSNKHKLVSLDQLLSSHNEDELKFSDELIVNLKAESSNYKRKNEHLIDLLNDNEATVARLTEQALLLKAEIRRLENNQERDRNLEDHASKEYLKNVIIKFLHYDTKSDERNQLVPVLVTLLSLDTIEKELLLKFCKICSYNKKDGEGWSSYFSWTGIS